MGLMQQAAEAAERTPDDRNRHADLLRVVAIGSVVVGHWLVMDVDVSVGGPVGRSVLSQLEWGRPLTWLFQVIPTFFLVGGYVNAVSWRRHADGGGGWDSWLRRRSFRLLWPTAIFVLSTAMLIGLADLAGAPGDVLDQAGWAVAFILWFLAVYLVVAGLTPMWVRLFDRFGPGSVVALITGAVLTDLLRFGSGFEAVSYVNFVFVWGGFHQVGIAWKAGVLGSTRRRVVLAAASAAMLIVLVNLGPYPVSMVTVPGADIQNTTPPTLALLAYGLAQSGLVLATQPLVEARLQRLATWKVVVTANTVVMSVFLWHVVPVVLVAGVLSAFSVTLPGPVGSSEWLWFRPVWVLMLALTLAPIVALVGRFERPPQAMEARSEPCPPSRRGLLVSGAGAMVASVSLALLALEGVWPAPGSVIPAVGIGALFAGLGLLMASAGSGDEEA